MKDGRALKDALWCDCESDEERVLFLKSGRAHETGIIASALQEEVAEAFQFRADAIRELTCRT